MREICRAKGYTTDEFLDELLADDPFNQDILREKAQVQETRRQKKAGKRPLPSSSIIDRSQYLSKEHRLALMDHIATLVDENAAGRSDMCQSFATLLNKSLRYLGLQSRVAIGSVTYYNERRDTVYRWPPDGHDWVIVGDEIVDGNADILFENPRVPKEVRASAYWGPAKHAPTDRKYNENRGARTRERDDDAEDIWWPDLKTWIDENLKTL